VACGLWLVACGLWLVACGLKRITAIRVKINHGFDRIYMINRILTLTLSCRSCPNSDF